MSVPPVVTTPLLTLQRVGWLGLGESRTFMVDALGGFHSLREQIAQELGPEAEADMIQRAGYASAQRFVAAGLRSGDLTGDEAGFRNALALLGMAGYGRFAVTDLRFADRWARVALEQGIEGWMFRETGSRATPSCDYVRGILAGTMQALWAASQESLESAGEGSAAGSGDIALSGESDAEVSCVESSCIAAGEETCQFVLGPAPLLSADGLAPMSLANSSVRETLMRLNRQLEQILDSSRKDSLTKLYNRAFFETALRQRIGYAKRRSDVVSLAIIDIDSFKSINDTYGHSTGDRVLRQVARSLEQQARENDVVARLGGDEFVWLMPATPGEAALNVAQRLRGTLSELGASAGANVTVSIGVAGYPHDAGSHSELFDRADIALFAAKRAGRNREMRYDREAHAGESMPGGATSSTANGRHASDSDAEDDLPPFPPRKLKKVRY